VEQVDVHWEELALLTPPREGGHPPLYTSRCVWKGRREKAYLGYQWVWVAHVAVHRVCLALLTPLDGCLPSSKCIAGLPLSFCQVRDTCNAAASSRNAVGMNLLSKRRLRGEQTASLACHSASVGCGTPTMHGASSSKNTVGLNLLNKRRLRGAANALLACHSASVRCGTPAARR
jgi:hypothetical protein